MYGKVYLVRKVLSFSKAGSKAGSKTGSIAAALTFSVAMALAATSVLAAAAPAVDPLANPPVPAFPEQTGTPAPVVASSVREEVIATGLNLPRSLVALPDGKLIVTEGSGTVQVLGADGALYVLAGSEANNQTNRHFAGEVLRLTPQ